MARQDPAILTRVAVGSGRVGEDANLADQHELMQYVADGTIGERRHEDDHLHLTVKYENTMHPDVPTFYRSEFMIYATSPVTGEETDFLYATLGDYIQPVPAYRAGVPPTELQYPLTIVVSSDLNVGVTAPSGLVTYDELSGMINALGTRTLAVTIPADCRVSS